LLVGGEHDQINAGKKCREKWQHPRRLVFVAAIANSIKARIRAPAGENAAPSRLLAEKIEDDANEAVNGIGMIGRPQEAEKRGIHDGYRHENASKANGKLAADTNI
jgi:hypothetical protein